MNFDNASEEQKEQFMAWYQQIKQKEREEHIKKTKEGMAKTGAKPGRRPLDNELLEEIRSMKEKGYRNSDISQEFKDRGKYLSTKTVGKYLKIMRETKEGTNNEVNKEETI
jgi:DNA invertase Pin-like site-specific DNA recombinase